MATGVLDSSGWQAAPPTDMSAGGRMFGYELADPVLSRAGVGGPSFPSDAGYDSTGFTRISTGPGAVHPSTVAPTMTTWRSALDWQDSPTFWILLFAMVAVGFLAFRLEVGGHAGRLRAHAGVAI